MLLSMFRLVLCAALLAFAFSPANAQRQADSDSELPDASEIAPPVREDRPPLDVPPRPEADAPDE